MKNLLSNLCSSSRTDRVRTLAIDAVSLPSFCRVNMLKLVSVLVILLTIGSGNVWGADETLTITRDDVTTANNYGTDSEWEVGTISGKCQIYGSTTTSLQFNGGKPSGTEGTGAGDVIKSRRCWNTTAMPGKIKSITITTASGTERAWRVFCSTSAATSSSTATYGTEFGSSTNATTSGTTWSVPNNDNTNYTYFMAYSNTTSASYIASIVVTYEGAPDVTYTVTWNDNGGQIKSEEIAEGSTSYSCPSAPSTSARGNCGDKFMGWTTTASYTGNTPPAVLFTDDSGTKPAINGNTDFYAVFADEE